VVHTFANEIAEAKKRIGREPVELTGTKKLARQAARAAGAIERG
jgi:hypothetical protein